MNLFSKITTVFLILIYCTTEVRGQEFFEDGSMKLSEISTNKKYGYEPIQETSIKVGNIENEYAFLKALRGPNGEHIQYHRLGSCCGFKSEAAAFGTVFLDQYKVSYKGLKEPIILYLNGYDYENPKAPVGFTYVTADRIEIPIIYPADRIVRVDFCNPQTQFAVKEILLKNKIGELSQPDTNPIFKGGIEKIKKYFANKPLSDKRAKSLRFKVNIAFIVDCKGNAGNYMIISKGEGLIKTLANQVLECVNKMPQNWIPATKDGENVDCYQVLSFIVDGGQLENVSYR